MTDTNHPINILLVEDDDNLRFLLYEHLQSKGFAVKEAVTGQEAISFIRSGEYDLCILDVMLPEIDGFSVAEVLRKTRPGIPFVFLTAREEEEDRLHGFRLGAEDYIVKPFSLKELYYRVLVVLRRANRIVEEAGNTHRYEIGTLLFNSLSRELIINDTRHKLSQREAMLLEILLQTPGKYVPRAEILKNVWGNDNYFTAKSMDVYVTRVRKILKDDPAFEIENLYGNGFRIKYNPDAV